MPRRRTKQRPALGAVSVNNVPSGGAAVGAGVSKQPSSSGVASPVEKKSKSSTTTSEPVTEKSSASNTTAPTTTKPTSQPSPYTVISCLENLVHFATKRSPGGRGILLNDISEEYRQLYGQDMPSIKTFEGKASLSAVLRECCSQTVTVVNGRAVWVEDKENAEEDQTMGANVEGKVANDNASVPSNTVSNDQEEEEDDDADDEDYDPVEDAFIEEDDLTFVTADDFIDEAVLFAEEEEEEDEDFDPIKDSTIQKDDLNLRAADGFIDEAILFAEEKHNEASEDDDADDEDFDPIKDSTIQKNDLNLRAADGFIDEAILHADEEKKSYDKPETIIPSPTTEKKLDAMLTQNAPTREVLLNRIESIVMLATIEHGGILLKDIAPQYCQEFGEGIPVKKCFGPSQNLRKALTKWSPCVSVNANGRASWVEPTTIEEEQVANNIDQDSDQDDEDYDPATDSSATSADVDLHNPDGFFDASTKAINKEVKALADGTPPHVPRDVLLNRIKCIVKEASADISTGINMAKIVPAYKSKYGDKLSVNDSFGIKLKGVLIQFFPEVTIVGTNAVWVEPDGYNSEEDEDFDPMADSTVEGGDMDLIVANGVVVDEAELVLKRIESIVEDASPNGIEIPQIRAKYEKLHGPLSCTRTFGPHLSLKWALVMKSSKSIEVTRTMPTKAIWRAASTAIAEESVKKESTLSNVEKSMVQENATGEVVEEMLSSAEDSAEMREEPKQSIENPYSDHKEDEEPEPVCAMGILMYLGKCIFG